MPMPKMTESINDIKSDKTMRDTIKIANQAAYSAFCGAAFAIPVTAVIVIVLIVIPAVVIPSTEILGLVGITIWGLLAVFISAVIATQS